MKRGKRERSRNASGVLARLGTLLLVAALVVGMAPISPMRARAQEGAPLVGGNTESSDSAPEGNGTSTGEESSQEEPPPEGKLRDPKDMTTLIMGQTGDDYALTITQGGNTIGTNGTLDPKKAIDVSLQFRVPVWGDILQTSLDDPKIKDHENQIILRNDWAEFVMAGFTIDNDTTVELTFDGTKVGTLTLSSSGTGDTAETTARIDFDGDNSVFGQGDIDQIKFDVSCTFTATLQYVGQEAGDQDQDYTVTIFGKDYIVHVPKKPNADFAIVKKGEPTKDHKQINWTVTVSPIVGAPFDISGYTFTDDLSGVGAYVADSFHVNSVQITPDTVSQNPLTYTFPEGTTKVQTITFSTQVAGTAFENAEGKAVITNTASVSKDTTEKSAEATVTITPTAPTKTGKADNQEGSSGTGDYNPTNRTITWTIMANQDAFGLANVVITDKLQGGLTYNSAQYKLGDAQTWTEFPKDSNQPTNPFALLSENNTKVEFTFATLNTPVTIEIVTKVPDASDAITGVTEYKNNISMTWQGFTGGVGVSKVPSVNIGFTPLTKAAGRYDAKLGQVTWNLTVNGRNLAALSGGMRVFELFVYDKDPILWGNLKEVTGDTISLSGPSGVSVTSAMFGNIAQSHNQKFVKFENTANDLSYSLTTLTVGGVAVADLVCISAKNEGPILNSNVKHEFTITTQVMNKPELVTSGKVSVTNTASLFAAGTPYTHITDKSAPQAWTSKMLIKDAVPRGTTVGGAPTADAGNKDNSFNYESKSVLFRLHVNQAGMNVNEVLNASGYAGVAKGPYILTDTLPQGWEFQALDGGTGEPNYAIYEKGTKNQLTPPELNKCEFSADKRTVTFTFSNLSQAYVILLRAGPTKETAEDFFSKNGEATVRNNSTLTAGTYEMGVDWEDVKLKSTVLSKQMLQKTESGVVDWAISYQPGGLSPATNLRLEDTLPEGLELRTDSKGELLLEGENIKLEKLTLQNDGNYNVGDNVPLILSGPGRNLSYDPRERVLTLYLADPTQALRLSYRTDITAPVGTALTNTVKLVGGHEVQVDANKKYAVQQADYSATLKRGGALVITKTGGDGNALAGVAFALYDESEQILVRRGTSKADGKVTMMCIPEGTYHLKELSAPAGYGVDPRSYVVKVNTQNTSMVVSVDGGEAKSPGEFAMVNHKIGNVGHLKLTKTVAGATADKDKPFAFTVTLSSATPTGGWDYIGDGVPNDKLPTDGRVTLAHGQSITLINLPKDATYTVTEDSYAAGLYETTWTSTFSAPGVQTGRAATGTIAAGQTDAVTFTNTRAVGMLEIAKKITGGGANQADKFTFAVVLLNKNNQPLASFPFGVSGASGGATDSTGKASFDLGNGGKVTFIDLPVGAGYTVTEDAKDYTATKSGDTGTIAQDVTAQASFTNHKNSSGGDDSGDSGDGSGDSGDGSGDSGDGSGDSGGGGGGGDGGGGDDKDPKPSSPGVSPSPGPSASPSPGPSASPSPAPSTSPSPVPSPAVSPAPSPAVSPAPGPAVSPAPTPAASNPPFIRPNLPEAELGQVLEKVEEAQRNPETVITDLNDLKERYPEVDIDDLPIPLYHGGGLAVLAMPPDDELVVIDEGLIPLGALPQTGARGDQHWRAPVSVLLGGAGMTLLLAAWAISKKRPEEDGAQPS